MTYILASGTLSGGGRLDGGMSQQPNQNGRRQVEHPLVWHLSLSKKYCLKTIEKGVLLVAPTEIQSRK
jgi:hypothetical protein